MRPCQIKRNLCVIQDNWGENVRRGVARPGTCAACYAGRKHRMSRRTGNRSMMRLFTQTEAHTRQTLYKHVRARCSCELRYHELSLRTTANRQPLRHFHCPTHN